ncbi:MAG: threonine/serine dehydratase [Gemmatimonadota bacterium]
MATTEMTPPPLEWLARIVAAERRIRPHLEETALEPSPSLSRATGAEVLLKLENTQPTGSFKVRGALSKLLSMTEAERSRGVVTASTGNHGAAVAFGLSRLGARGTIFVPHGADTTKVEKIRQHGGTVEFHGDDSVETERHARAFAAERGEVYVSAYNDRDIVAGQGTIGAEVARQVTSVDIVIASVGGGGLIGGIASYFAVVEPTARIWGASPENSAVMMESVKRGAVIDMASLPTLSDGTAGGVELDALTFPLCRDFVHEYDTVTEQEIARAMRLVLESHGVVIEGAAGVAVAMLIKRREQCRGKRVVIVVCGGNVRTEVLRQILADR